MLIAKKHFWLFLFLVGLSFAILLIAGACSVSVDLGSFYGAPLWAYVAELIFLTAVPTLINFALSYCIARSLDTGWLSKESKTIRNSLVIVFCLYWILLYNYSLLFVWAWSFTNGRWPGPDQFTVKELVGWGFVFTLVEIPVISLVLVAIIFCPTMITVLFCRAISRVTKR